MIMKRLVSGVQPTGTPHIGNYLGAFKQWIDFQQDYDSFFFIADYHALTTQPDPKDTTNFTYELLAMLVALGLNPRKSTIFLQSSIPQHTELSWILNSYAYMGELERMTQYKEKSHKHNENAGLFTYPVLQTADVAIYNGELVPVGEDQVQHLELAREIVRRFNTKYGEVLTEARPLLTEQARVMSLTNPDMKMSKSEPAGCLFLADDETTIMRKIKRAVTESNSGSKEMGMGVKNLFGIMEGFSEPDVIAHFRKLYKEEKLSFAELKDQVTDDLISFLKPVQKTYNQLIKDHKALKTILESGREKALPVAEKTLKLVKEKIGLVTI